jgi:hypothetical protein
LQRELFLLQSLKLPMIVRRIHIRYRGATLYTIWVLLVKVLPIVLARCCTPPWTRKA